MSKPLYDTDLYLWSTEQGRAIREAAAARIDTPAPGARSAVAADEPIPE